MPSPAETLLTTLGLQAEDITAINAVTEDKPFDPKPYVDKVKTNYQTQFQNDPAFFTDMTIDKLPPAIKKQMESGQYARATNIAKEKIAKALGFSEAEIADLATDDYKALDFYVPAITEKWTKNKSGSKEVQEQLIAERRKNEEMIKKYGPDYEKEVETRFKTESETRVTEGIFNASVVGELSSIPDMMIAASDVAKTASDILLTRYGYARVGDFSIGLRNKDNQTMKVLKPNSSQEVTLREALTEIAIERGWIKPKQEGGKGSGTVTITPNGKGGLDMLPAHIRDKVSKKIAEEQG